MPSGKINALAEDDYGFLWVSLDDDLYRFDGTTFYPIRYEVTKGKAPLHAKHFELFKDREGDIWATSWEEGFFIYSPKTESVRNFRTIAGDSLSMPDLRSNAFYEDSKGRFWVAFHKEGFGLFNKRTERFEKLIKPSNYLENLTNNRWINEPLCFHFSEPFLWIGTVRGLLKYDLEKDVLEYLPPCLPEKIENPEILNGRESGIVKIWEAPNGDFWLSTWGAGLCRFNPKTGNCRFFRSVKKDINIVEKPVFIQKSDLEFWVGMKGGQEFGIFNLKDETFSFYNRENLNCQIEHSMTFDIFKDSQNRLWLANEDGLWVHLSKQLLFPVFRLKEGNQVLKEFSTQGELFFTWSESEKFGIQDTKTKEITIHSFSPLKRSTLSHHFLDFHRHPEGEIFFHEKSGIYKWDAKDQKALPWLILPDSILDLPNEFITSSLIDKQGTFWGGMRTKGLVRVDLKTKNLIHYQNKNEQEAYPIVYNGYVNTLLEDSQGRIWHGTERGFGYFDYEKEDFVNFPFGTYQTDNPEIILKHIYGIVEDRFGRIWLGSNRKGIGYLEFEKDSVFIKTFSEKDGLRDDGIRQMLSDKNGDIWLVTNEGVSKLDVENLTFENYGLEYGIGKKSKLSLTENGEIILPYSSGYFKFRPEEYHPKTIVPKVALISFQVFDQPFHRDSNLNLLNEITLNYTQNFFSFEFGSINFFNPELIEYAFRLKGLEEKWNTTKERRYASYTNVSGGKYVFQLKARIETGEWGEVKELKINIVPPFWQTWWFAVLILSLLCSLIYGYYQLNIRQIKEKEALKTNFNKQLAEVQMTALRAQMNPHFLFNCLNSIKLFIIKNNTHAAAEYLTKFSRLIRHILQNSKSQLVLLSNELEALELYIEMERMRFRNQFSYTLEIDENIRTDQLNIPPLILQPYVENAIWHGLVHEDQPNHLLIQIFQKEKMLHCIIEDNGIGRLAAKARKAHQNARKKSMGMSITQNRINLTNELYNLKTDVRITDLEDEKGDASGTRIEVIFPILKDVKE